VNGADWPGYFISLLQTQNPSLLMAVTASAARDLNDFAPTIQRLADTSLDSTAFATLQLELKSGETVTLLFDPRTFLLRRATYDVTKPEQTLQGGKDVKPHSPGAVTRTRNKSDWPFKRNWKGSERGMCEEDPKSGTSGYNMRQTH
jgi:hypothetical protein